MQYNYDVSLPIYTNDMMIRNSRKKIFIEKGEQLYPNAPQLKEQEYQDIKQHLESGDSDISARLMEFSIKPIIVSLSSIYARYDLEDILSYEEALSYCLEKFNKKLNIFTSLPENINVYRSSIINLHVYKYASRRYSQVYLEKKSEVTMPKESVVWQQDHDNYDEINIDELNKDYVRNLVEKAGEYLTAQQKRAVMLRFGFETGEPMNCAQIGRICNVTRGRARDLVLTALEKLKRTKEIFKLNTELM